MPTALSLSLSLYLGEKRRGRRVFLALEPSDDYSGHRATESMTHSAVHFSQSTLRAPSSREISKGIDPSTWHSFLVLLLHCAPCVQGGRVIEASGKKLLVTLHTWHCSVAREKEGPPAKRRDRGEPRSRVPLKKTFQPSPDRRRRRHCSLPPVVPFYE